MQDTSRQENRSNTVKKTEYEWSRQLPWEIYVNMRMRFKEYRKARDLTVSFIFSRKQEMLNETNSLNWLSKEYRKTTDLVQYCLVFHRG